MEENRGARRVIQVSKSIVGPVEPKPNAVRPKRVGDYPGVPGVYLQLARKFSSPRLMGPPICDELIALLQHTFTEEEAGVVRHLGALRARGARGVARAEHRPLDEVERILHRLAFEKRTILCDGPNPKRRYTLLPVMPGMYEMVLIGESPERMSEWHRRFAELVEALFETGYTCDYPDFPSRVFRFLPLGRAVGGHPMALPSDRLEVVLERFDTFGVGHCQCRMSQQIVGQGCGKPLEVCTAMGDWARLGIARGWLRRVARDDVLAIKREAESHGLVTWLVNVESTRSQASCSCCGCCCKAMRVVSQFNVPGVVAPPHFMPRFDRSRCTYCGRCAASCPMGAITVDTERKSLEHEPARCIGCGLCRLACDRRQAIAMEPVPDYRVPYKSWFSLLLHNVPGALRASWKVPRSRRAARDDSQSLERRDPR